MTKVSVDGVWPMVRCGGSWYVGGLGAAGLPGIVMVYF